MPNVCICCLTFPAGSRLDNRSSVGIGPYVEVAFFHKRTRTLLVTDCVIYIPSTPPEVTSCVLLLASYSVLALCSALLGGY